jgi:hypothetical protein
MDWKQWINDLSSKKSRSYILGYYHAQLGYMHRDVTCERDLPCYGDGGLVIPGIYEMPIGRRTGLIASPVNVIKPRVLVQTSYQFRLIFRCLWLVTWNRVLFGCTLYPYYFHLARRQVADGGDCPQLWRLHANMFIVVGDIWQEWSFNL